LYARKPLKQILPGILAILNRREKIKLGKLILFDFVIGMLDIGFLVLLLIIINFYTKNTFPSMLSFLPRALVNRNSLMLIGAFFVLFGLKNWFGYIGLKSQHHFFLGVASRLSKRNIQSYLADDYSSFINTNSSVQVRKISLLPIEFSNFILTNFQQVISQIILILLTVGAILVYHPTLFLFLFLLLLPPVASLAWFIHKKLKNIRARTKIISEKNIQHLQESLYAYVESNIYHKNKFFVDRYISCQQELNRNIATQQTLQGLPSRLVEVFAVLGFLILIAVNKLSADKPAIDLLTIGVFMAAAYKIIPGIIKILNCTGQMKTYRFTLTDLLSDTEKLPVTIGTQPVDKINSLRFENVHFKYKDHTILSGVSFELMPGDFAGISGVSGKGKTTIINLLLGFLEPDLGGICLNNRITGSPARRRYWNKISYVKQQSFFIHDTIQKNITLSDKACDEKKLKEVLSFCGIDELLEKYPDGLDKVIAENGKNISGGQRQRTMLARALYHDFDLLILDEPFGEMDDASERKILLQLQRLAEKGKMILFITHNKTSLSFCNKTFSLDGEYA
jgi:ABC-type multidrug transport system fused ATPase/permease subunit